MERGVFAFVMKNNTLVYRMGQLEDKVGKMDKKLEDIMENHLPHINEKLSSIGAKQKVYTAFNVGAIIAGVLIAKYL